jgi:hypothetical protein
MSPCCVDDPSNQPVCSYIFSILTAPYLVSSFVYNTESVPFRGYRALKGTFCKKKVCCYVCRLANYRMEPWHQRKICHLSLVPHWWLVAGLAHSQDLQETRHLPLDVMRAIPQVCDQCADNGLNTVKLEPKEAEWKHLKLCELYTNLIYLLLTSYITENTEVLWNVLSTCANIYSRHCYCSDI